MEDRSARDSHSAVPFGAASFQNLGFHTRAIERRLRLLQASLQGLLLAQEGEGEGAWERERERGGAAVAQ